MKRTIFLTLFFLGVFTVYAQSIDKASYTELTYDDFMAWLDTGAENRIPVRFKMHLKYDGPSSPGYNFKDGDEDIIIISDTEVNFERGQEVIVYFTASGPLVWDRSIDIIEAYDASRIDSPSDIIDVDDAFWIASPLDPNFPDTDSFVSSPSVSSSPVLSDTTLPNPVPANTDSTDEITLVPSPGRPPDPGPARIRVPPNTGRVVIRIDQDSAGNLWLSLEESGNPPPPNAYPPNPSVSRPAEKSSPPPEVEIIPKISSLNDQKLYKLQVGAFIQKTVADDLAAVLRKEGFSLNHEKSGNWNRIIITGIRGADVGDVAERLGAVGIKTVWVRE
jgi:hypothetical protein